LWASRRTRSKPRPAYWWERTVGYISPEQLLGERPAVSWELWGLAVVAYECVAGALPFPVASRQVWRQLLLGGRPTPVAHHVPAAPQRWQQFFDGCLALDITRRPRSAAEFLRQLEEALGGGAAL